MGGWKTWSGALLALLTGVATSAGTHFTDLTPLGAGLAAVFSIVGIGHKIEKGAAVVAQAAATVATAAKSSSS